MEEFISTMKTISSSLIDGDQDPKESLQCIAPWLHLAYKFARLEAKNQGFQDIYSEGEDSDEEDEETIFSSIQKDQLSSFLSKFLPKMCHYLLERSFDDDSVWAVQEFLQAVINIVVAYIPLYDIEKLFLAYKEILDEENRFYNLNAGLWGEVPTGKFATSPKNFNSASAPFLVSLLNVFGSKGGFVAILTRIRKRPPKVPLRILNILLKPLAKVRHLLKTEYILRWIIELKDAVFDLVLNLTDQELKEASKKDMTTLTTVMGALLLIPFPTHEAGKIIENFRLSLCLKCLASESLEKRINGLSDLNELIEMVVHRENIKTYHIKCPENLQPARWLDSNFLTSWIQEHKILESVFGPRIHSELVQRSVNVLVLLCVKGMLNEKVIDLLWDSSIGKQETLVEAIYTVITKVISYTPDLWDYLTLKIKDLPVDLFDKNLMKLVSRISTLENNSAKYIQSGKWYILDVLWNALKEETSLISEEIKTQCLNMFIAQIDNCPKMREPYIIRCINNIKEKKAVAHSLTMMLKLLETLKTAEEPVSNLIMSLQENHRLLDLVISELCEFRESTRRNGDKMILDEDTHSTHYPSSSLSVTEVKARMKFIKFLLLHSQLQLSLEQVNILWDTLISKATPVEKTIGFQWFEKRCGNTSIFEDGQKCCQFILKEKFSSIDFSGLSESGFSCFKSYFQFVNAAAKRIKKCQSSNDITVLNFDLIGMDTIWQIALLAKDHNVAKLANEYINSLYEKLSPELKSQRTQLYENFLATAMTYLQKVLSSPEPSLQMVVERCVTILMNFVDKLTKQSMPITVHCKLDDVSQRESFSLQFKSSTSLRQVRDKIKERLISEKKEVGKIKFVGSALKDMNKSLFALDISHNSVLYYSVEESSEGMDTDDGTPMSDGEDEEGVSVIQIISKNKRFLDLLFQILDLPTLEPNTVSIVWNLLQNIPNNPEFLQKIYNCEGKWEEVLDQRSLYRLLHATTLLERILADPGAESWTPKFVQSGGFQLVYKIFMENDNILNNMKCVHSLLRIISLLVGERTEEHQLKKDLEPSYVLKKDSDILQVIQFPAFFNRILHVSLRAVDMLEQQASSPIPAKDPREETAQLALMMIYPCIQARKDLLPAFMESIYFQQICEKAFFSCSFKIRELTALLLYYLAFSFSNPETSGGTRPKILSLLLELLPKVAADSQTCVEYFKFVNKLVQQSITDFPDKFWESLFSKLVKLIKEHPLIETSEDSPEDRVLIGLVNIMCSLMKLQPTFKQTASEVNLLEEIFTDCLFEVPNVFRHGKRSPPKCKTKASRHAAFKLLRLCATDNAANLKWLLNTMIERHFNRTNMKWDYSPVSERRSSAGYSGLKNLGCTCYINSLLQQLFMIPRFRKGVLALKQPEKDRKDSIIYQLQVLFSHLQESQRMFFNPADYVAVNKDYEGNPINVFVQMDVDEYFNILGEKLDNLLKGTPQAALLHNIWCGKLSSQLICKGCPHRYERADPFYTISLDIKNKSNILEALELYVKGEMLEGDNAYNCEKCGTKRDALKRTCIKTLPNTLILHLKRFEFDFDSMRKVKLNDYCEFPMKLNMEPYTTVGLAKKEAELNRNAVVDPNDEEELQRIKELETATRERSPSYYEYELSGILVHRGGSESGHYYSFIKEKATVSGKEPRWLEFNDKIVKDFNPQTIKDECFGGTEVVYKVDPNTKMRRREVVEKTRNAYMLLYERVEFCRPEKQTQDSDKNKESVAAESPSKSMQIERTTKPKPLLVASCCILFVARLKIRLRLKAAEEIYTVAVPSELYHNVWKDNEYFINETRIFSEDYAEFVLSLIKSYSPIQSNYEYDGVLNPEDLTFRIIHFATQYFFDVLAHSRERSVLDDFTDYLSFLYEHNTPACKWLVQALIDPQNIVIRSLLTECSVHEVRSQFANFLVAVCAALLRYKYESEAPIEADSDEEFMETEDTPLVPHLIQRLFKLLQYDDDTYRYFDEYFVFFDKYMKISDTQFKQLIDIEAVQFFVNFFLTDEENNAKKLSKRTKHKRKGDSSNFSSFITLLANIVCRCRFYNSDPDFDDPSDMPDTQEEGTIFNLSNRDVQTLCGKKFLVRLFKCGENIEDAVRILQHISWNDEQLTNKILTVLIGEVMLDTEYSHLKPLFKIFKKYILMYDEISNERISLAMSLYLDIMIEKRKLPKKTRECVGFLKQLSTTNPQVHRWCLDNAQKLEWIRVWEADH